MLNFIFIFLKFTLSLTGGEEGGGRLVIPSCSLAAKIDEWWKNYMRNCDIVFQIFLHLTVKYFYNTCLHVFFFRKQVKKALSCNRYKMITIKSLLDPQSCGFVKALLYLKSCRKVVTKKFWNYTKGRSVTKKIWTLIFLKSDGDWNLLKITFKNLQNLIPLGKRNFCLFNQLDLLFS